MVGLLLRDTDLSVVRRNTTSMHEMLADQEAVSRLPVLHRARASQERAAATTTTTVRVSQPIEHFSPPTRSTRLVDYAGPPVYGP